VSAGARRYAAPPAPLLDLPNEANELLERFYSGDVDRRHDAVDQLRASLDRGAKISRGKYVKARDAAHLAACCQAVLDDPPRKQDLAVRFVLLKLNDPPKGTPQTERIALESSYNTLIKVQSATLNTLREGVAVFGPDGKLKLYNAAFATIWELTPKDLAGEPHVRTIAAACAEKFGDARVWESLIQTIVSGSGTARDLGEIERSDHTILALSLSPLPDGAILTTFSDVTDRSRIEHALHERNAALEAADRLKSDFIKHVSYELRTPLNTIMGFAEMLDNNVPGALNNGEVLGVVATRPLNRKRLQLEG